MDGPAQQPTTTLAELLALPDDEYHHELVNGWLVSEPPPGVRHGHVAACVAEVLRTHVRTSRTGVVVTCDTGFILHRSPDTVRAPDVAFIRLDRYQALEDKGALMPGPPDLAVEVLSPSNRASEIHAKVADYLTAGTTVVWVVDPAAETVRSYRTLFGPETHSGSDLLAAEDLLLGFGVRVAALFEV